MTKFADNNTLSTVIDMTLFFVNKNFHSRMNFSLNPTVYDIKREQLLVEKVKVITNAMQKTLKVMIIKFKMTKEVMMKQINKHKKKVISKEDNLIFFSSRNLKTVKSVIKLKDKMLSTFKVKKIIKLLYQLKLSSTMRIHDVFHFSLLRKDV